jgi:uncharacterized protein (TIGR03382 family)
MDQQTIFNFFEDPFVTRLALDDPFVIDLAMIFGVGALGMIAALAVAALLRRRKTKHPR